MVERQQQSLLVSYLYEREQTAVIVCHQLAADGEAAAAPEAHVRRLRYKFYVQVRSK